MEMKKRMNNSDKKFLCALVFAQTGLLSALIMFSPWYWLQRAEQWKETKEMAQFGQFLREQTAHMESEAKVQSLKNRFEKKGIGVEETFDLNRK